MTCAYSRCVIISLLARTLETSRDVQRCPVVSRIVISSPCLRRPVKAPTYIGSYAAVTMTSSEPVDLTFISFLTPFSLSARRKRKGPQDGADLRFFSPEPDASLHCQTTDTGLVHRAVWLFTSQLSLVLIAPTHEGMARMS